jgi:hypothetical protein
VPALIINAKVIKGNFIGDDSLLTHPIFASLDHPLFGKPERGGHILRFFFKKAVFYNPLFAKGEERVAQRSVGGVSNLAP